MEQQRLQSSTTTGFLGAQQWADGGCLHQCSHRFKDVALGHATAVLAAQLFRRPMRMDRVRPVQLTPPRSVRLGHAEPCRAGRLCSLRGARPSGARHVLDRCDLSARTTLSPPARRASYRVTPPARTQTPHQLKVAIACLSLRRDSQRPFSSLSFCRCLHHAVTLCPWECMCSCVMSSVCGGFAMDAARSQCEKPTARSAAEHKAVLCDVVC